MREPSLAPSGGRSSPHERARILSAHRLDARLEPDQREWLDEHLAACGQCRAEADAFEADRLELRALARQPIEPPRDLWARTAAAIERDAAAGHRPRRSPLLRRRPSPVPLGVFAGLLVVAVVFGASILSVRPAPAPGPRPTLPVAVATTPPARTTAPGPTPIAVPPGGVDWVALGEGGRLALYSGVVSQVCAESGPQCPPIEATPTAIDVPDAPTNVVMSPGDDQLVVVDPPGDGEGGTVFVVPVPGGGTASPPPNTGGPTDPPSLPPTASPPASPAATLAPTTEPTEPNTPEPTEPNTPEPATASPAPATASPAPATPSPTTSQPTDAASPLPVDSPTPTAASPSAPAATASAEPPASASPNPVETPPAPIAIAHGVKVVGEVAAFSPDGRHFAFTARPDDGSHGPDIYLWTVGEPAARPITADHRSVFSGWVGSSILGSRAVPIDPPSPPAPSPATTLGPLSEPPASAGPTERPGEASPQSFVIDPQSGLEAIVRGTAAWRPSVDPSGRFAVYWEGTLRFNPTTVDWRPADGRLVVGPWPGTPTLSEQDASLDPSAAPAVGAATGPSPLPVATVPLEDPSPKLASVSLPGATDEVGVLADGPVVDWEARWDEEGGHLAVWIADPDNPSIGRLALYAVDGETGTVDVAGPELAGQWARPGFAIGEGHLAWATPPGQNGISGSQVEVVAWTDHGIGAVQTQPGEDVIVIKR